MDEIQSYLNGKISFDELEEKSKYDHIINLNINDKADIILHKNLVKKYKFKLSLIRSDYGISSITANHIIQTFKENGWEVEQVLSKYKIIGQCSVCGKEMKVNDSIFFTGQCPFCEVQRNATYLLRVYDQIDFEAYKIIEVDKLNEEDINSFVFQLGRICNKQLNITF